jgi:hypothetical protein
MTDIVRYAVRFARMAPIGTMLAAALVTGPVMAQTMAQTMAPALDPEADAATIAPAEQLDFSLLIDAPTLSDHRNAAPPSDLAAPPATIGSRVDKADGSMTHSAGEALPIPWDAKVGVDLAAPAVPTDTPMPGQGAEDHGSGWANLAVPAAPIGLDKATIDARVDPAADQGRLSTALSRSLPIGGGFSLTLQNGYAVTQTLANPNGMATAPNPRIYTGDGGVKLDLPTQTAVSARASMSSSDDRPTPSLSAEQKLFDTPLSITGTISQRPTGETDRSIMAGFKQTW